MPRGRRVAPARRAPLSCPSLQRRPNPVASTLRRSASRSSSKLGRRPGPASRPVPARAWLDRLGSAILADRHRVDERLAECELVRGERLEWRGVVAERREQQAVAEIDGPLALVDVLDQLGRGDPIELRLAIGPTVKVDPDRGEGAYRRPDLIRDLEATALPRPVEIAIERGRCAHSRRPIVASVRLYEPVVQDREQDKREIASSELCKPCRRLRPGEDGHVT